MIPSSPGRRVPGPEIDTFEAGIDLPSALDRAVAAGAASVRVVLPSAERRELEGLTGGRARLARAAALLARAASLGLEVTLVVPVFQRNHRSLADLLRRARHTCATLRAVVLDFQAASDLGLDAAGWDFSMARDAVAALADACLEAGLSLAPGSPPPPCVVPGHARAPSAACDLCAHHGACAFLGTAGTLAPAPATSPAAPAGAQSGADDDAPAAVLAARGRELADLVRTLQARQAAQDRGFAGAGRAEQNADAGLRGGAQSRDANRHAGRKAFAERGLESVAHVLKSRVTRK